MIQEETQASDAQTLVSEEERKSKANYPTEWEEAYKVLKEEMDEIIHDLKQEEG